mmetsp:Transcript_6852/g.8500  ORF Transcript_6852/g.8500 Transcript_6852/m.8500 type:complete len:140 (-) Transcript_6852:9-428(-)
MLYNNYGILGPWIAITPTLFGTSMYYGIKFYTFDICKGYIENNFEYNKHINTFISGVIAGMSGNIVCYPNNCIRKRMQYQSIQDSNSKPKWFNSAKLMFMEAGILRFYRGFGINLFRNAPNTAIQFVVYEYLRDMWINQ